MAASRDLVRRLRTFIIARLFIAAFLLFYAQFVFNVERIVFYGIIAAVSVLSVVYLGWWLSGKALRVLAYLQIALDLILESVLVYYTGGVESLFVTIFILSILAAAAVISPESSFYFAVGASAGFISAVLLNYLNWAPGGWPRPDFDFFSYRNAIYVFYASYVWVTVFFLVAVLAFYFSRMIRRLQDTVKTQERLVYLGEVAAGIAHEIRNPLTAVSGSVQLLERELRGHLNEEQKQLMTAVVDESERINQIFTGLLDYTRVPELRYEEIDLSHFLDQILFLLSHQNDYNSGVSIERLDKGKNIKFKADPEYLKQAAMNVLANAFQAMPAGGRLMIDGNHQRNHVEISFKDTGIGMDKQVLNSIFVPFHTTKPKGTGLGMAHAYKVIAQHRGRIHIQSKKGIGTEVAFVLPLE